MTVCNACRYCEAVLPGVSGDGAARSTFAKADLALPREPVPQLRRVPLRVPVRAAARVRHQRAADARARSASRSYEEYCWPRRSGAAFTRNGVGDRAARSRRRSIARAARARCRSNGDALRSRARRRLLRRRAARRDGGALRRRRAVRASSRSAIGVVRFWRDVACAVRRDAGAPDERRRGARCATR